MVRLELDREDPLALDGLAPGQEILASSHKPRLVYLPVKLSRQAARHFPPLTGLLMVLLYVCGMRMWLGSDSTAYTSPWLHIVSRTDAVNGGTQLKKAGVPVSSTVEAGLTRVIDWRGWVMDRVEDIHAGRELGGGQGSSRRGRGGELGVVCTP